MWGIQQCCLCHKTNSCVVCKECAPKQSNSQRCQSCATNLKTFDESLKFCGDCLLNGSPINHTWAIYDYADPTDSLIKQLKYQHRLFVGAYFAQKIADFYHSLNNSPKHDVIIPMPLHSSRLKERGFNQSIELALKLGITIDTQSCQRIRNTPPFFELNKKEREKHIKNAFAVVGKNIKDGQKILLFDDITTTSSSLLELANTIKRHQPSVQIDALCLARA